MDNLPNDPRYGPPAATGPNAPIAQQAQFPGATGVSVPEHSGAYVVAVHTTRYMKIYPIPEHELEMLKSWGSDKTLWASIGSGILAVIIEYLREWTQLPDGSHPTSTSQLTVGVLAVICVLCFWRANWRKRKIDKTLGEIESRPEVI